MNWINTALLSAAVFGVVNIIDSHLISKRMPSLRAFLLPTAAIHLTYSFIFLYLFPLPAGTSTMILLVAIASGLSRTAGVVIMLSTLKREEVSRVVPIAYTYPIFVALMAVPLLGESLHYLEWVAIIIVVSGAVMVSARQSPSGATTWLGKMFILLLGSSLLLAMADIASKYVLAYISFWNLFWLSTFSMSITFLIFSTRPHVLQQLITMKRRNTAIALLIFNELLAPVAVILSFWSIEMGPVSLVSTIISTRPVFVLIFAFVLSRILPQFLEWQPGRGRLALRLAATVMIIGGIAIIHLA